MTATLAPPAPPAPAPPPVSKRKGRRWLRLVVPFLVVLTLIAVSVAAYLLQQPNQRDAAYLSPTSTEDIGASRLADLLRQRGITIERETKTSTALDSAYRGGATLFVPTPDLMQPYYVRMLKLLPESTRIVLVEPGNGTLRNGYVPIDVANRGLTARAAQPGCDFPAARDAGPAAVHRSQYSEVNPDVADELHRCYNSSLVVFLRGSAETTVVGAADPFRNDRIGEHHNQQLAVGLLARSPRLIWLDLHRREAPPRYDPNPRLSGEPDAPASLGPGSPDPDFPMRGTQDPAPGATPPPGGQLGTGDEPNPLLRAFPRWLFAAVALLALATLFLALARARRLGAPVTEPLPVFVRATETVEGRGRLYQRAKARAPALHALRTAARERLAHLLDLGPNPGREALVAAAAAQSGWAPQLVDETLFGPDPDDDEALSRAAMQLEALMAAIRR
jgi:hypothetical protein